MIDAARMRAGTRVLRGMPDGSADISLDSVSRIFRSRRRSADVFTTEFRAAARECACEWRPDIACGVGNRKRKAATQRRCRSSCRGIRSSTQCGWPDVAMRARPDSTARPDRRCGRRGQGIHRSPRFGASARRASRRAFRPLPWPSPLPALARGARYRPTFASGRTAHSTAAGPNPADGAGRQPAAARIGARGRHGGEHACQKNIGSWYWTTIRKCAPG